MKNCKRCKGEGAQAPLPGDIRLEKTCWICQGAGKLLPPDALALRALVLTKGKKLQPDRPKLPHKLALSFVGKSMAWGKVAETLDDVHTLWKGSIEGRRSYYLWKVLKGIARTTPDVLGTDKFDPYREELLQLATEIKGELRGQGN